MKGQRERIENTLLKLSGLTALLLLWELSTGLRWIDPQFVPSLSSTMKELYHLWMNGDLFTHGMVSLWRALNGLIVACVIALPMGFILGRRPVVVIEALNPLFRIFAQVNPFSLMPVFILFFGIGEEAKLAVVAWVCIWPVLFNTMTGVRTIDASLIKSAKALNISDFDLLKKVYIPAAAPHIFMGLRVGVEMSFFMLIASEMIGSSAGLGWLMHNSAMNYQVPRIYAAAICIVALGLLLNRFLKYLQKRLFFWKQSRDIFNYSTDEKVYKKLGKASLAVILFLFAGIIIIGSYEVNRVNLEETKYHHSGKNKMESMTGSD